MIKHSLVPLLGIASLLASAEMAAAKTFVLPHVLEVSGLTTVTNFTTDTTIVMTYSAGLVDSETPKGASADLYLYDASGQLMKSGTGRAVCNPCGPFVFDAASRKHTLVVDNLITAAGGFGAASVRDGFGVVVVTGDHNGVSMQGFVVNSHSSPFDLAPPDLSFLPLTVEVTK